MMRIIDPTHMTNEENNILKQYLIQNPCKNPVESNQSLTVNLNDTRMDNCTINENFELKYELFYRACKPTSGIFKKAQSLSGKRYEVNSEKKIGTGGMSIINELKGTLVLLDDNSKLIYKNKENSDKKCVVKEAVYKINSNKSLQFFMERIKHETELSSKVKHLHFKPTTYIQYPDRIVSYSVERYLPGQDLIDILIDRKEGLTLLTKKELFNITKQILTELIDIHKNGIIHCDIKPENIRVDRASPTTTTHIFDFGLSIKENEYQPFFRGTNGYAAPEVYNSFQYNIKNDIFATGVTLGLLWGATVNPDYIKNPHKPYTKLDNLFTKNIPELDPTTQTIIKSSLYKMFLTRPEYRISLAEVLDTFIKAEAIEDMNNTEINRMIDESNRTKLKM